MHFLSDKNYLAYDMSFWNKIIDLFINRKGELGQIVFNDWGIDDTIR